MKIFMFISSVVALKLVGDYYNLLSKPKEQDQEMRTVLGQ